MLEIVLTPEQSAQLAGAQGPVVLVNPQGQRVGQVSPPQYAPSRFPSERIAEAEARIGKEGPGITTTELLARLQRLKQP